MCLLACTLLLFGRLASELARQAELEARLELQEADTKKQSEMLTNITKMIADLATAQQGATPAGAAAAAQQGAPDGTNGTTVKLEHTSVTQRRHSFKHDNLPPLAPSASMKECSRWIRAVQREAERADLRTEPRTVQIATVVTAMSAELREQVSDFCGVDLDLPPGEHNLDMDGVLSNVEKFFTAQSDQLGAFVAMVRRRQQPGESVSAFAAELKRMGMFTQFGTMAENVREAVVLGVFTAGLQSEDWRQKLLDLKAADGTPPTMTSKPV